MGLFSPGKKLVKFLIVAIDYFTKWLEVEPLATITEAQIRNFLWKNIVCRFEIPNTMILDNWKQFDNPKFQKKFTRSRNQESLFFSMTSSRKWTN